MNKSSRIAELDILRLFCVILVVIGHSGFYQIVSPYGGINYDILIAQAFVPETFFHLLLCNVIDIIYSCLSF